MGNKWLELDEKLSVYKDIPVQELLTVCLNKYACEIRDDIYNTETSSAGRLIKYLRERLIVLAGGDEVVWFDIERGAFLGDDVYLDSNYIKAVRGSMGFAGWKLRKEFVKLFVEIYLVIKKLFKKEK